MDRNNQILGVLLAISFLSLAGFTLYAQGVFFSPSFSDSSRMSGETMQKMYQEQMEMQQKMMERVTGNKTSGETAGQPSSQEAPSSKTSQATTETALPCSVTVEPVCGVNGQTYKNACFAEKSGIAVASQGACPFVREGTSPKTGATTNDSQTQDTAAKIVEQAKKAKKSVSLSKFNKTFSLGPGVDREIFFIKTTGNGTLEVALKTTSGTFSLFKLETAPTVVPEKQEVNQLGVQKGVFRIASFHTGESIQQQAEDAFDDAGAALYTTIQEGTAPLLDSIELDDDVMKNLQVTVTSQSGEGTVSLEFSGDAIITSLTRKEPSLPSLSPAGKIIVPLVMHELDRYFKSFPGGTSALDTTFSQHLATTPLAHIKLQNTLSRFKNLPSSKKNTLFHAATLAAVESANGGPLSEKKITEIKGLLATVLPPKAPTDANLSFSQNLSTSQGGVKLNLKWKHKEGLVNSYVIERGLAADIEQDMDIGSMDFTPYKTISVKKQRKGGKKQSLINHIYTETVSSAVHSYCYRVKAVNAHGPSAYSNVACPQQMASMVKKNYSVKWTRLHSRKESAVDGLSNSDEPYLVFTMVNGMNADGTPRVWTRSWTGADDVDSFESEPDEGQAHFTLFGPPPSQALQQLQNLRNELASTPMYTSGTWQINPAWQSLADQIDTHEWGTKAITSSDVPTEIDLSSGLILNIVAMEHDDGASMTLEEQIKAAIYAAQDVVEAFASPDPYHVAIAVKSTLEFAYTLWANDDYIGSVTLPLTYWDAWAQATPPNSVATRRFSVGELGTEGEYNIDLCYYPQGTLSTETIKELCTLPEPY